MCRAIIIDHSMISQACSPARKSTRANRAAVNMAEFSPSGVDDLVGDSEGSSAGSDADVEASDDEEASGEQASGQTADMEEDEPEARYACILLCYYLSCLTHAFGHGIDVWKRFAAPSGFAPEGRVYQWRMQGVPNRSPMSSIVDCRLTTAKFLQGG